MINQTEQPTEGRSEEGLSGGKKQATGGPAESDTRVVTVTALVVIRTSGADWRLEQR